jgi:hypothetical protein
MRPLYRRDSFRFAPAVCSSFAGCETQTCESKLEALLVQNHQHRGHPSLLGDIDNALP